MCMGFVLIAIMNFASRALHNNSRFFIPHPPSSFGRDRVGHLANGIPSDCLMSFQRNEKHFFLILVKIPLVM